MQRPSKTDDIYERLGVSRSSLTPEHLTYMYRQKCMVWNPDVNARVTSRDELDALKEAYDTISFHLETQRMIEVARRERDRTPRPVGKRGAVRIDTVDSVRQAYVEKQLEAHLNQ